MLKSLLFVVLLSGCTTFSVLQTDDSPGERKIITHIKGVAWFSSAQNLTGLKAIQTDKTQSFGTATFGQQGATNAIEALKALARIAEAVRPTP